MSKLHRLFVIATVALAASQPARADDPPRTDRSGDPLPAGALARLGTVRFRHYGASLLTFSPDGKLLASARDGSIKVWETATGKELRTLPGYLYNVASAVSFEDNRTLRFLGADRSLQLWDVTTGKEVRRRPPPVSFNLGALSPDGKRLAVAYPQKIDLWDLDANRVGQQLTLGPRPQPQAVGQAGGQPVFTLSVLAFSPDGSLLAVGNGNNAGQPVRVWEVATGKERLPLLAPALPVTSLLFSPDGQHLAVGSQRQVLVVYDLANHKELYRTNAAGAGPASVTFTADGKLLAVGHVDKVSLVELATGKLLREVPGSPSHTPSLAFAPGGKLLAIMGTDGTIRLWDPATGKEVRPTGGHQGMVVRTAYAPDGKTIATAGNDHTIRLWDAATGRQLHQFIGPKEPIKAGLSALAFVRGGQALAAAWSDGIVRTWDVASGKELAWMRDVGKGSSAAAFSPDGRALVATGPDGVLRLWSLATGRPLRRLAPPQPPGQPVMNNAMPGAMPGPMLTAVAFSPDGRTVASAHSPGGMMGFGGNIGGNFGGMPMMPGGMPTCLWETATGKLRGQVPADQAGMMWFNPYGSFNGGFGGGFGGHPYNMGASPVHSLVFAPGGRTLVLVGQSARLWDVAGNREIRRLPPSQFQWTAAVAFSPDGKLLALGSHGSFLLSDAATGEEVGRIKGHDGAVTSLTFSPDGKRLVSGGFDTTALVWDVERLLEEARRQKKEPSPKQLEALWTDLGHADAERAGRAMWSLAAAPRGAVPLLRERLQPVAIVDAKRIAQLVADLDHKRYVVRLQAEKELEKLGELAEPALQRALESQPSLELQRRVEQLLEKVTGPPTGAALRALRAVEALEHAGTAEARQVLEALAKGAPEARLTREAQGSLERLEKRAAAP
jgi:WD40 repeat protein